MTFSVYCANPVVGPALKAAVSGDTSIQVLDTPDRADIHIDDLGGSQKLRLGALIDWLYVRAGAKARTPAKIEFLASTFDPLTRTYTRPDGKTTPLTERERDVLLALYSAPEATLTRAELLRDVWGYVPGLETHTLETHIYRLRQKIEDDPSRPHILVTTEAGYTLIFQ